MALAGGAPSAPQPAHAQRAMPAVRFLQ